ncbi:hypothetical protein [Arthrobacter sp. zg-Y877]|uniref:hypothetical protein n=1 Tax=Arthrobacter sp. zg-Y877 TaxID=3049074 RepID=UPI0025A33039|nr:hypothetical protein [Arthrobacter sp. zg-Y877]MDM7991548.1 hypothetical protein [Arthrobacter sp. zg-Y877]
MPTRKAPPMFWTWSAHTGVFGSVAILVLGALGMLLCLSGAKMNDFEFVAANGGMDSLMAIYFVMAAFIALIPAVAGVSIVYVEALPLRDMWAEYRQAGWSTWECRTVCRRARAAGTDLIPAPHTSRSAVRAYWLTL